MESILVSLGSHYEGKVASFDRIISGLFINDSIYLRNKQNGRRSSTGKQFCFETEKPNILAESLSLGGYKSNRPSFYGMQFIPVEGNGSLFALRRKYEWILTGISDETGKDGDFREAVIGSRKNLEFNLNCKRV